jgi:hypothetical protein
MNEGWRDARGIDGHAMMLAARLPITGAERIGRHSPGGDRTDVSGGEAERGVEGRSRIHAWLRVMAVTGVVALVLAVSGGFGTRAMSILPRILYWLGVSACGAAIGILVGDRLWSRPWFARRPWVAGGVIGLSIAPPISLLVWGLNALINRRPPSLAIFLTDILPSTLATALALTALALLTRLRAPAETHAAAPGAAPPKFLARLPARLAGAEIWAVEAQDHYLRLHTSRGREMILLRLTDAIAELEGIEGARTHRSWWVARAAVTRTERTEGRAVLTLVDGSEVPVSRAYVASLRAAGWL